VRLVRRNLNKPMLTRPQCENTVEYPVVIVLNLKPTSDPKAILEVAARSAVVSMQV